MASIYYFLSFFRGGGCQYAIRDNCLNESLNNNKEQKLLILQEYLISPWFLMGFVLLDL